MPARALRRLVLLSTLLALAVCPAAAIDKAHYRELNRKARGLAKQQDWKGARDVLVELGKELPAPTPRYLLTMASVETHLSHTALALEWLARYSDMGLSSDVAQDDDLKPLLAEPGFAKVAAAMKERTRPVAGAELVCALPQDDIMPEDITYEPSTGGFIVSSIQHHTLYRVTLPKAGEQKCGMEELPLEASAKRWPVLAVSADAKRKLLWMTTSAMPGFTGFPQEDQGKAALLAVEAKTGKTVRRFDLDSGAPAVLGDMSLAPDGAVYVTDSVGGGVYRVRGDLATAKLEKIADGLFSPQTPALARDGKRLFVADYTMGIAVVDLTGSAPVAYLPHPENIAVVGLDGLYLAGDALVGIQNGTEPERIVRYRLDPTQTKILSAEVLEQAREHFGDATHAAAKGGSFYVSANVGWSQVDDSGKLKPGARFTAPVILRLPPKGK